MAAAIESLYRHCLIPAFETGLRRRRVFRYLRELEESQWRATTEIRAGQLQYLRRLLVHAFDTCPYYHDTWMRSGLDPRGIRSLEDFVVWPLLHRETVRSRSADILTSIAERQFISKATGGSSGVPLQFSYNLDSEDRRVAASHRGYNWAGAGPGTRQVYLWGVPLGNQSAFLRLKQWVHGRCLYRRSVLNTFNLSDATVQQFLEDYERHRPDALIAYVNPLYDFARSLEKRGIQPFAPRTIVVGAEKLHSFQRELIQRVFRAPVFETYGSREFMLMGAECERHQGLHLTMESLLVEIVDDEGRRTPDGEEGNIVVTDLFNFRMPFVRYVTGDRALAGFETCSCGRGLPLLRQVVGRQLDIIHTPDGRHIPGEFFPHLFKEFAAVERFQVVQSEVAEFEIKLIVDGTWDIATCDILKRRVRETVGQAVRFTVRIVDDIPLTRAGKRQVVVNFINTAPSP